MCNIPGHHVHVYFSVCQTPYKAENDINAIVTKKIAEKRTLCQVESMRDMNKWISNVSAFEIAGYLWWPAIFIFWKEKIEKRNNIAQRFEIGMLYSLFLCSTFIHKILGSWSDAGSTGPAHNDRLPNDADPGSCVADSRRTAVPFLPRLPLYKIRIDFFLSAVLWSVCGGLIFKKVDWIFWRVRLFFLFGFFHSWSYRIYLSLNLHTHIFYFWINFSFSIEYHPAYFLYFT